MAGSSGYLPDIMLFALDMVSDECILGWVAPDNPSRPASLTAVTKGRTRHHVPASSMRADVQAAGFHKTGLCGFRLDVNVCPWYVPGETLELYETESNFLVYRRHPAQASDIRLLHVETQTLPLFNIGLYVTPAAQMVYSSVEMVGEETLNNLLLLHFNSIVVSGSVLLRRYEAALRLQSWRLAICLAYPYRELAARLLHLKMLAPGLSESWRGMGQGELIEHFAPIDLTEPASLGRAFRRLSDEQFHALADPTTRLLVCQARGEPVQGHQFGPALSRLAEFDLIGVEDRLDFFLDGLGQLLGRDDLPREVPPENPQLAPIIAALELCRPAQDLVQFDMALYEESKRAVERGFETEWA